MIKYRLIVLLFFLNNSTVFSQGLIGFKTNLGLSMIMTKTNPALKNMERRIPGLYFESGFYFHYFFNSSSTLKPMIGAEFLGSQVNDRIQIFTVFQDPFGGSAGSLKEDIWRELTYISYPVYFGITLNKVSLNFGIQFSNLFSSKQRDRVDVEFSGEHTITETKSEVWGIVHNDYGIRQGVIYNYSKRVLFEANYYAGLKNLLENSLPEFKWNVLHASVGVLVNFNR
jgi:hypothetical protein